MRDYDIGLSSYETEVLAEPGTKTQEALYHKRVKMRIRCSNEHIQTEVLVPPEEAEKIQHEAKEALKAVLEKSEWHEPDVTEEDKDDSSWLWGVAIILAAGIIIGSVATAYIIKAL